MKKRLSKLVALLTAVTLVVGTVAGCTSNDSTENNNNETSLSGTITLAGSTSMQKVAEGLKEGFMAENPDVTVDVQYNGSSAGIEQLLAGTVQIGNASRNLKDAEKTDGAVENIIAMDGMAVITDKNNAITELTREELVKIYTGEIKNWSKLGGADMAIVVVGREAGSGTRGAFEELLEIEYQCAYAQELDSAGTVLATVATTEGAIGYVSLDVIDDTVSTIRLEGVEPTEANIVAGDYSLCRPFVMATKGEISEQTELVKAFFEYIKSEEGKAIIKQVGLILPE